MGVLTTAEFAQITSPSSSLGPPTVSLAVGDVGIEGHEARQVQQVEEGATFILKCRVVAQPAPNTLEWTHNVSLGGRGVCDWF